MGIVHASNNIALYHFVTYKSRRYFIALALFFIAFKSSLVPLIFTTLIDSIPLATITMPRSQPQMPAFHCPDTNHYHFRLTRRDRTDAYGGWPWYLRYDVSIPFPLSSPSSKFEKRQLISTFHSMPMPSPFTSVARFMYVAAAPLDTTSVTRLRAGLWSCARRARIIRFYAIAEREEGWRCCFARRIWVIESGKTGHLRTPCTTTETKGRIWGTSG